MSWRNCDDCGGGGYHSRSRPWTLEKKKRIMKGEKGKNDKNLNDQKAEVPPRFELGLLDSESNVLTTRPWNPLLVELVTYYFNK